MPFGMATATATIRTGNVRTSFDPATPPQTAAGVGVVPQMFYQGLYNTLGQVIIDQGGSDSVSGTTTQLPVYAQAMYKYVLYKSTTNPALQAAPGVVYYTDNTFTVVSGTLADGLTGKAPDAAGVMMINTTDLTTITATILNNGGNGSGIWICISGFVKQMYIAALTVATGDYLYGTTGGFTPVNVADGAAAPIHAPFAIATSASAANKADVVVRYLPYV